MIKEYLSTAYWEALRERLRLYTDYSTAEAIEEMIKAHLDQHERDQEHTARDDR